MEVLIAIAEAVHALFLSQWFLFSLRRFVCSKGINNMLISSSMEFISLQTAMFHHPLQPPAQLLKTDLPISLCCLWGQIQGLSTAYPSLTFFRSRKCSPLFWTGKSSRFDLHGGKAALCSTLDLQMLIILISSNLADGQHLQYTISDSGPLVFQYPRSTNIFSNISGCWEEFFTNL